LALQYELKDQQLTYQFHPLDFTQVNQGINQQMVNQALLQLALMATDRVLDLFCGLGNFSLPMAQLAQSVVGVEGTNEMVLRAQENAKRNQISNVEFYACDLSKDFSTSPFAKREYDKILLDPPRSGAEEIVMHIARFKAKEILYISCNPATFARDAAILVHHHGYRLVNVGVMDMFPHTAHVEAMGLFKG
jgi:23S rRNA (uracil1939-C5)-methyltransferase